MEKLLSKSITLIHLLIVIFMLFGWLLPDLYRYGHLMLIPLVVLHWHTNDGKCFLTEIDNRIQGKEDLEEKEQGQFTRTLVQKVCGFTPTDEVLKRGIYTLIFLAWSASLIAIVI